MTFVYTIPLLTFYTLSYTKQAPAYAGQIKSGRFQSCHIYILSMKEVQWTYYWLIYSFIYYIQIVFLSCTSLSVSFLSCDVLHLCLIILPLTVFSQHAPFNLSQTALTSVGHFQQFVFFLLISFGLQSHFSEQLPRHQPQWHSRSHHLHRDLPSLCVWARARTYSTRPQFPQPLACNQCECVCVTLSAAGHAPVPTDGLQPNVRWEGGTTTSRGIRISQLFLHSLFPKLNRLVSLLDGLRGGKQQGVIFDSADLGPF